MTTPPPLHELYELRERMTTLEYIAVQQIPATIAAMNHGATQMYALTVANGEAIAGLRVDMTSLETVLRNDISDLRHAVAAQGDSLRKELGVATAGFRADVTGLRESMSMRFQKVDGQFNGLHAEMDQRFENVETQLRDLRADMDAKLDTILSELRRPAD
jgi:hypothetical protein